MVLKRESRCEGRDLFDPELVENKVSDNETIEPNRRRVPG
jgi:hypothetical protein